jgi:hypothetical protein
VGLEQLGVTLVQLAVLLLHLALLVFKTDNLENKQKMGFIVNP